ncbi:MAG: type II toxin-antitoxin system HicA family toxin [Planctomycetales bacterium]
MKRARLLQHLRQHGCRFEREGRRHSIWINPQEDLSTAVPRHREIPFRTAAKICRDLAIPEPTGDR